MTAHVANQINAFVLMMGTMVAYLQPDFSSWTVFIPGAFGVVLMGCSPGVKVENKVISHIAVLLTLVILIMLFVPFFKAIGEGDVMSALRVAIMLATCALAMVMFIKSFRDARRQKKP